MDATGRTPEAGAPPRGEGPLVAASYGARIALALLVAATAALWLTRHVDRPLTGDSVRYAAVAREMVESGDWMVPRVRGEPTWNKPPLGYWLAAVSISALGPSPFAAMLPSVVAGVLLVLLLFLVVDRLAGPLAGVASALLVTFLPGFVQHTASLRFESTLQLFGLLALVAVEKARARPAWFLVFWGLLGASVLTKNLTGLMPLLVLALTALATRRAHPFHRPAFWGALPAALVVAAPWYVAISSRYGEAFWATHLGREVGERVAGWAPSSIPLALGQALRFAGYLVPLGLLGGVLAARDVRVSRFAALGAVWIGVVLAAQVLNRMPFARYMYALLVPLSAFAGYGIGRLLARRVPRGAAVAVAAAALAAALVVRVVARAPGDRAAAQRAILVEIDREPAPGPLLAIVKDPDQAETFVWFHLHRHTEAMDEEAFARQRAERPLAFRGRLAIVDDRGWDSLDLSTVEVVRRASLFSLVRLR